MTGIFIFSAFRRVTGVTLRPIQRLITAAQTSSDLEEEIEEDYLQASHTHAHTEGTPSASGTDLRKQKRFKF